MGALVCKRYKKRCPKLTVSLYGCIYVFTYQHCTRVVLELTQCFISQEFDFEIQRTNFRWGSLHTDIFFGVFPHSTWSKKQTAALEERCQLCSDRGSGRATRSLQQRRSSLVSSKFSLYTVTHYVFSRDSSFIMCNRWIRKYLRSWRGCWCLCLPAEKISIYQHLWYCILRGFASRVLSHILCSMFQLSLKWMLVTTSMEMEMVITVPVHEAVLRERESEVFLCGCLFTSRTWHYNRD